MSKLFSLSMLFLLSFAGAHLRATVSPSSASLNTALLQTLKKHSKNEYDLANARKLIARGACITSTDITQVLGDALYHRDISFAKFILNHITAPALLNYPYRPLYQGDYDLERQGFAVSLLGFATDEGLEEIVQLLKQKGAQLSDDEVDAINDKQFRRTLVNQGCTAAQELLQSSIMPSFLHVEELRRLQEKCGLPFVKALVEAAGYDVNKEFNAVVENRINNPKSTVRNAELLLELGAQPAKTRVNTLLKFAFSEGQLTFSLVKTFIKSKNDIPRAAVAQALKQQKPGIALYLLNLGADALHNDLLMLAIDACSSDYQRKDDGIYLSIAQSLLKAGAPISSRVWSSITTLATEQAQKFVELFMSYNPDLTRLSTTDKEIGRAHVELQSPY